MSTKTFIGTSKRRVSEITPNAFVVVGIPSEFGCAGRSGTALAPRVIRITSLQYSWPDWNGYYDPSTDTRILTDACIVDIGDINGCTNPSNLKEKTMNSVKRILGKGGIPVVFGGDHSVSEYVISGYPYPIQIVQLDAHSDYQRPDETDATPSGVVMRQISAIPNVTKIIQVGMRGYLNSGLGFSDSRNDGNSIVPWIKSGRKFTQSVVKEIDSNVPTYLSIDTDFFDPSICPGTTVPEPNGPIYPDFLALIKSIVKKVNIIGIDLVELNPKYDYAGITSLIATKLILDTIGLIYKKNK